MSPLRNGRSAVWEKRGLSRSCRGNSSISMFWFDPTRGFSIEGGSFSVSVFWFDPMRGFRIEGGNFSVSVSWFDPTRGFSIKCGDSMASFILTLREASALRVVISWFRFFGLTLREVSLLEIASTLVESDG